MTDDNNDQPAEQPAAGAGADEASGNQLQVQKIYLKDASFEAPNSPQVFATQWQPQLDLQLHSSARKLGENSYEVVLSATATAKKDETSAFLAEVELAGLFQAQGFTEEEIAPVLGIYCPQLLFPYLRETIASLTQRGGFPPLELQPVNFEVLYRRELQRRAEAAQGAEAAS